MIPLPVAASRAGDQLEVLENAAARGSRLKTRGLADIAAREQALDDLVYRTQGTTLRNTEEYPRVVPRPGYDEVDGSYPARRTSLLPGQTYPDMSLLHQAENLLASP